MYCLWIQRIHRNICTLMRISHIRGFKYVCLLTCGCTVITCCVFCVCLSHVSCFGVCESEIKTDICSHDRGGGNVPEYRQSPVLLFRQPHLLLYPPPTMPHSLGNRIMNTITAADSKSCLRGWFSSCFSRKMSWESLQKRKCEVFQVSVNVHLGLRTHGTT